MAKRKSEQEHGRKADDVSGTGILDRLRRHRIETEKGNLEGRRDEMFKQSEERKENIKTHTDFKKKKERLKTHTDFKKRK